jgi:hypothetical protein
MRFTWFIAMALAAGCASISGTTPGTRKYDAPMSRVKPAFISTLSGMGMTITALVLRQAEKHLAGT